VRRLLLLAMLTAGGAAQAETVVIPGYDVALRAEYVRPQGPATRAAIVALHGCGGPYPRRDRQWAEMLTGLGHAVLFPDSFGSRGLGSQCGTRVRTVRPGTQRRADALAAVAWLAERPETPPGGVVVMGWSNGGSTVLATAQVALPPRQAGAPSYPTGLIRGFVAFYPGCAALARHPWKPGAPMLILHGDADDWTPVAPCRALAAENPGLVTLVGYPGAFHDFDVPGVPVRTRQAAFSAEGGGRVHLGTDEAARTAALARVPAFLDSLPAAP
jgi:dienelactone hydrolase